MAQSHAVRTDPASDEALRAMLQQDDAASELRRRDLQAAARSVAAPHRMAPASVLSMQRSAGNRAVAAMLSRGAVTGPKLQRLGRISGSLNAIETKWDLFRANSNDVDDVLVNEFAPMLENHTKAMGMTKDPKKAKFGGLTYDKDKNRAAQVAMGLEEWVTSASEGAERYYAEMRQALNHFGEPDLDWQFGISDKMEPDVHSLAGESMESKRTNVTGPSAVDVLIREARFQSTKRVKKPDGKAFKQWEIAIEIASNGNPWPYTATELKKANVDVRKVPKLMAANSPKLPEPPASRINKRNLQPQKGKKIGNVPPAQAGKHEIVITWLSDGTTCSYTL